MLFLRKYFRFNYQLLWSEQDQPAFAAFRNHFLADECLPFIINKQNEHPYFFKPDKVTQQTIDLIFSFTTIYSRKSTIYKNVQL